MSLYSCMCKSQYLSLSCTILTVSNSGGIVSFAGWMGSATMLNDHQCWHNSHQHVPIWYVRNWAVVPKDHGCVLLDICWYQLPCKLWHIPDHLVNSVSSNTFSVVHQKLTRCKNLSDTHHDPDLDFPRVSTSHYGTICFKSHRCVTRCRCRISHTLCCYCAGCGVCARYRLLRQSDDIQCLYLSPDDAETSTRDRPSRNGMYQCP